MSGQLKAGKRMEKLFAAVKADFPTIFRDNEAIELNPPVLAYIVSQLQMYSLCHTLVTERVLKSFSHLDPAHLRPDRECLATIRGDEQVAPERINPPANGIPLTPDLEIDLRRRVFRDTMSLSAERNSKRRRDHLARLVD